MSKLKKILIGILIAALIVTGAAAGLTQIRKNSQKEVPVTGVTGLVSEYYMPNTNLDGSVTTSVSQNIMVDNDMIIEEVYVNQDDRVKIGDPLISFDTTLVEMELEIARLKHQQLEKDLNRAVNRLKSLKNGGPIIDGDYQGADNLDSLYRGDEPSGDDDTMSSAGEERRGVLLAAAMPGLLQTSFVDEGPEYNEPSAGDFTSDDSPFTGEHEDIFGSGENDSPRPSPGPTPDPEEGGTYDPYFKAGLPDITDGDEVFYEKLDSNSQPFTGSGTKQDPYVFLVSSFRGQVTAMGSFFNKMAKLQRRRHKSGKRRRLLVPAGISSGEPHCGLSGQKIVLHRILPH